MFNLIDIGVNLMHARYQADREEVVNRAKSAGVCKIIITGTNLKNSREAAIYAKSKPGEIYSTAGVHPHDAKNCSDNTINEIKVLAQLTQVVAIGECGLDFNRDFSPRQDQEKCFEEQVKLACELNMPLFMHERDAHNRFIEILSHYRNDLNHAVIHCFTGSASELETYLELGLYIGITGWICDERRGHHLRDLLKMIPLNRLMLETDAPFLTPRDMRPKPAGGRNEPAFLPHILKTVAQYLEKTEAEVATATSKTTREFFGLEI
jgi:TatD DNase family protein